jgi:hypothetical protein
MFFPGNETVGPTLASPFLRMRAGESLICWVDLNPGLSHIESGSPSFDSVATLIGGTPHFHG